MTFKKAVRRFDFPDVPSKKRLQALMVRDTVKLMSEGGSFGYATVKRITDLWITATLLDSIDDHRAGDEIAVKPDRIFKIN